MRDNRAYLCHISEAIQTIESYIAGHTFEQFQTNKMMIDAVVRELEIIGEKTEYESLCYKSAH